MRIKFFYKGKPVEVEGDFEVTINNQGINIKPIKTKEQEEGSKKEATASRTWHWTPEEDAQLFELISKGLKADEIAAYLGRTPSAVSSRLYRLKKKGIVLETRAEVAEQ